MGAAIRPAIINWQTIPIFIIVICDRDQKLQPLKVGAVPPGYAPLR